MAELLEFSESDELDSLPELDELLEEEPELVVDVDSELVVFRLGVIFAVLSFSKSINDAKYHLCQDISESRQSFIQESLIYPCYIIKTYYLPNDI